MSSSGANNGEKTVTLRANDGEEFAVAESVVALSHTIKFVLEDSTMGETSVIPLFKVDGKTLAKILEYCKVHTAVGKTDAEKEEFDRKFVEVDQAELYALLIATNYLGISELQEKLVRRVADMITGKTPEEIRETFNIKKDLSPEEEEEIRETFNIKKDLSPEEEEEIRETFNIKKDLSPEEEEEIKRENPWAF
nr:SKP1-like protein 1A [Ipomoea trifida]